MSYQYKNKSEQDLIVPGVGEVAAGEVITSATVLENANLELVDQTNNQGVVGTEAPQPGAIVEAQKVPGTNGLEVK